MEMSDWIRLFGLGALFGVRIFLAAAETALLTTSRITARRLVDEKTPRAENLLRLLENQNRFLPSVLLLILLVDVAAAANATFLALKFIPFGAAIATGAVTLILFVYGEMIPKTFVVNNPERAALKVARPITMVTTVFYPLAFLFIKVANVFIRLLGGKTRSRGPFLSEDEIKTLVSVSEEEGVIEAEERRLIHSIFEFGDTVVREVMVPRIDMKCVPVESSLEEVLALIIKEGHSRIPVYEETIDNIAGIVYARDLLLWMVKGKPELSLKELTRPRYVVPETKKVNELLKELQRRRQHMAIVVDEYGQTAGLVTIEDLLEEIVGEIFDEYDIEESIVESLGNNNYRLDARMNLDDLKDLIGLEPPEIEVDTVGGLLFNLAGRVPVEGEKINYENFVFTVETIKNNRLSKVLLTKKTVPSEEKPAESG